MDYYKIDPRIRIYALCAILGVIGWPSIARIVRGQILSLREQEFMVATEATGIRISRRIFRHLIPNVIPQLIVFATMGLGDVILMEATLSFLGIGVKFPYASWGNIVNAVNDVYVLTNFPFVWIPAGCLILLTVLGFNFVGDGLRDAFDPEDETVGERVWHYLKRKTQIISQLKKQKGFPGKIGRSQMRWKRNGIGRIFRSPEYLSQMKNPENVVEFDDVHTYFFTDIGTVKAVDGVSFDVPQGKTVGIVGESGCGKSVTSLSLMQLVQRPQGQTVQGEIRFNTGDKVYNIVNTPTSVMQKLRGNEMAMIFQEPMTALNPVFRIGEQVDEITMLHNPEMPKAQVKERTLEMLKLVGIANCEGVYKMYPHELSGGMRQRVCIAIGLACNPRLIIADEPTTALDVTIQAQILDLMRNLKDKINSSIMLITHDLGVIAEMADYVVIMYAGRVVGKGTAREIFNTPSHPYTIGLMRSKPVVGKKVDKLYSIPGKVPNPINMPDYCYFRDRCELRCEKCQGSYPGVIRLSPTHEVSCYRYQDRPEEGWLVKEHPGEEGKINE